MTLLLMDTSGEYGVLALADADGSLRAVQVFPGRRTLSQRLLGVMDGLLRGEGLTLADVTGLGIGIGPGSFTGVRVGVTTAKTLAQVTGLPLVGIPTLEAYAACWNVAAGALVVLLPSRRGEVYAAVSSPGQPHPIPFAESVDALERRIDALSAQGCVACCGAVSLLAHPPALALELPYVPPEGLARVAAQRLAQGMTDDPLALTPLYVVPPAISVPKEKPP